MEQASTHNEASEGRREPRIDISKVPSALENIQDLMTAYLELVKFYADNEEIDSTEIQDLIDSLQTQGITVMPDVLATLQEIRSQFQIYQSEIDKIIDDIPHAGNYFM